MNRKRYDYPLDLVSRVAAQLLEGDDYSTAVSRTIDLLNACEQTPSELFRRDYLAFEHQKEVKRKRDSEQLTFSKAVKEITGEQKAARAEEWFIKFQRAIIGQRSAMRPGRVGKELEDELARIMALYRKEGFTQGEVDGWQDLRGSYERWRSKVSPRRRREQSAPQKGKNRKKAGQKNRRAKRA